MASDPQNTIESWDYSSLVGILTWLLIPLMVLSVFVRLCMKYVAIRRFVLDDVLILLSIAFAIAQSAIVLSPGGSGIGKESSRLSQEAGDSTYKTLYICEMLAVISVCFSRLSLLSFVKAITPVRPQTLALNVAAVLTGILAISGCIAFAAQCHLPSPWKVEPGRCFNRLAFVLAFNALEVINELTVTILPILIVYPVNMALSKRLTIIFCFASRIVVIAAIGTKIAYARSAFDSPDFVFDSWPYVVANQCVQGLSIITANVPCLKRFIGGLESGFIRVDDHRRRGQSYTTRYTTHHLEEEAVRESSRFYYMDVTKNGNGGAPMNVIKTHVSAQVASRRQAQC